MRISLCAGLLLCEALPGYSQVYPADCALQGLDALDAACPVAAEVIPCAARTVGKMVSDGGLSATSKDTLLQCLSDAAEPVPT